MRKFVFDLTFHAPAFLGNAEQSGQWRTPPFKAQLRQWWRMAYAAGHVFKPDVDMMRREEGRLFGHAWLENDRNEQGEKIAARKSLIRIRLSDWQAGAWNKGNWPMKPSGGRSIAPDVYLGYGPLPLGADRARRENAAIQAGAHTEFSLALHPDVSDAEEKRICLALWLMDRFGTVGGRSRNGWGSYGLKSKNTAIALSGTVPQRPWQQALELDWPQALGSDEKGLLIWRTEATMDWIGVIRKLAEIRQELRKSFSFPDRYLLSYPVTKHQNSQWNRDYRLPNSLRFKILPVAQGGLAGAIFHVPSHPPEVNVHRGDLERVWRETYQFLDRRLGTRAKI